MVKRVIVGAHYGHTDWLAQRVTAVVMAAYSFGFLAYALYAGGFDYARWSALFGTPLFRLSTFVFMLALLWHAWVGVRDIWMDYIKPVAVRLTLETITALLLIAYAGWTIEVLWGRM
jgi:succinate dehydrogenase / fumarate reductase membrane anchor subunit